MTDGPASNCAGSPERIDRDDPRPEGVRQGLDRVALRWRQLSFERAEANSPAVHQLAQHFADLGAGSAEEAATLPELGAAVVIDQLSVTAYDACAGGKPVGRAAELRDLLTLLR